MSKSLLKEAEKNIVRRAKWLEDVFTIIDALERFAYNIDATANARSYMMEGIDQLRNGMYRAYYKAIHDCFVFANVGGDDVAEYSKKMFKEYFGNDDVCIMNFLDKFGRIPNSWLVEDEENFRKEGKEIMKKMRGKQNG